MGRISAMVVALLLVPAAIPSVSRAETPPVTEQVVEPQIDRRTIKVPHIGSDDFEVGAFAGIYSAEDFGSSTVKGLHIAYHVTEDIFFEGTIAQTKVSDEMFRQVLPGGIFEKPEEDLRYYNISVGYNFFPGEVFIGKKAAFASAVYVVAGVGSTDFMDEKRLTVNAGMGIRLLLMDWLSFHIAMRDHVFETDILGRRKNVNNFELSTGLAVFF
jgi:outer membrane beta-barrel protein